MKFVDRKLFYLYLIIQCIIVAINFYLIIHNLLSILMIFLLCFQSLILLLGCLVISGLSVIYLISCYYSITATYTIIDEKALTKLQKFSSVIFPIITIIIYLYLFFNLISN